MRYLDYPILANLTREKKEWLLSGYTIAIIGIENSINASSSVSTTHSAPSTPQTVLSTGHQSKMSTITTIITKGNLPMSNYTYVSTTDSRFDKVFEIWSLNICLEINKSTLTPMYSESLGFYAMTGFNPKIHPHQTTINKHIKDALKSCKNSVIDNFLLGYDPKYINILQLSNVIETHLKKRRRKDYQILVTTSASLTTTIGVYDEPIPNLNLIMIIYSGNKVSPFQKPGP